MRLSLLVPMLAVVHGLGCEGGRCESPPCDTTRTCDRTFPCLADEVCDFEPNTCGAGIDHGVCEPRPTACPRDLDPVCGCDGQVHANPCTAELEGTDLDETGGCDWPEGQFACGARACNLGEMCVQDVGFGIIPSATCLPLPAACSADATCTCLAENGICTVVACRGSATEGLTVDCESPQVP